jgi:dihydrofolate reductase
MNLAIIVAMADNRVIGKDNAIPWYIPEDFKHFKKITDGNTLIMGQNTWYSIPEKVRPFSNRYNIVISPELPETPGIEIARSIPQAIEIAKAHNKEIFFIGGASIYEQTLPLANILHISFVKGKFEGDRYFPEIKSEEWNVTHEEDKGPFLYKKFERKV